MRVKAQVQVLKKWSEKHIAEVKSHLVKYGTKRNPNHFHWAVLRRAWEMTYRTIAEEWANRTEENLDLDETTVRKGVQAVLKVLDLRDTANRK